MQNQTPIYNTFGTARQRFRQLRHNISNPFRKSPKNLEIVTPSPSLPTSPLSGSVVDNTANSIKAMDGATERSLRRGHNPQSRPQVSAIFVHAGAGYHSTTNEQIHLTACDKAARMAMVILRTGGTSVDAVEAAIKSLEDDEITNAGFGSNLSILGHVECDATIVDHLGRSGACGATGQISNPIHLARTILDASNKPLSLRRVPPNLLVGQGATDFAYDHGIPIVPNEDLISKNANDRFTRWRDDLRRAEKGRMTPSSTASEHGGDKECINNDYEERVRNKQHRDHTNAMLHATWIEGQPDSPLHSPGIEKRQTDQFPSRKSPTPGTPLGDPCIQPNFHQRSLSPSSSPSKRVRYGSPISDGIIRTRSLLGTSTSSTDLHTVPEVRMAMGEGSDGPASPNDDAVGQLLWSEGTTKSLLEPLQSNSDDDLITDTVGAIAIDMYGNIAAGSSSGGIGMKHRGRVGPAALVGIGTAVIPVDDKDEQELSVAAVTSGTGEHMATTIASQKCAERLYHNTRRARGGADIEATEEEAMESFVQADFMSHPGVNASNSAGAIGIMAVKKTPHGYFLHFAHNTDSFALASMHSNEREPKCVMSRLGDHGAIVQGGRKVRI